MLLETMVLRQAKVKPSKIFLWTMELRSGTSGRICCGREFNGNGTTEAAAQEASGLKENKTKTREIKQEKDKARAESWAAEEGSSGDAWIDLWRQETGDAPNGPSLDNFTQSICITKPALSFPLISFCFLIQHSILNELSQLESTLPSNPPGERILFED